MSEQVYYFGYGANRDPKMIAAILGKSEDELIGSPAILEGYELGIQRLIDIPDTISPAAPVQISPRALLEETWGNEFASYVIRENPDSQVSGTVWELSPEDRERIRDWELIDFGWYEDCRATAITPEGLPVSVMTERIDGRQPIDHLVDGMDYPTWLSDIHIFMEAAEKARREYDARSTDPEGRPSFRPDIKNI